MDEDLFDLDAAGLLAASSSAAYDVATGRLARLAEPSRRPEVEFGLDVAPVPMAGDRLLFPEGQGRDGRGTWVYARLDDPTDDGSWGALQGMLGSGWSAANC